MSSRTEQSHEPPTVEASRKVKASMVAMVTIMIDTEADRHMPRLTRLPLVSPTTSPNNLIASLLPNPALFKTRADPKISTQAQFTFDENHGTFVPSCSGSARRSVWSLAAEEAGANKLKLTLAPHWSKTNPSAGPFDPHVFSSQRLSLPCPVHLLSRHHQHLN